MITTKKNQLLLKALCISAGFFIGSLNPLYANPTGGTVISGSATIGSAGNTTTINQNSDKAIINWNSFSIGSGETTRFNQPSSSSIALNRVTGNDPSSIFGNLSANGKIMLINPNGIFFGTGSNVDVAGLIATTAQIKDSDFLNGNHAFVQDANKTAGIVNEGTIKVADTGLAALVAPSVENRGIIQANLGKVVLGSGKAFTVVDTYGDNLIQFATDSELANAKVANSGTIMANGGKVLMTAKAAAGVVDNVINMDGVIEANSVTQRNGEIILSGGNHGIVKVAGTIKARGQTAGLKGGKVKITGDKVGLFAGTNIDASGDIGGGEVLVGGDYQGKNAAVQNANATYVDQDATVKANALTKGDGGKVIVWADDVTRAYGSFEAKSGTITGNGGLVETSGKNYLDVNGISVNTHGITNKGSWLLNPADMIIGDIPNISVTTSSPFTTDGVSNMSFLNVNTLNSALSTGDVIVQTGNDSLQGGGNGDIYVSAGSNVTSSINWTSSSTLTLKSVNNIYLDRGINAPNGGLILDASKQIIVNETQPSTSVGSFPTINVKNFTLQNGDYIQNISTSIFPDESAHYFNVSNDFKINGGTFLRVKAGDGTTGSPYQIIDEYGLQGIGTHLDKSFVLNNDIDASKTINWNAGSGFTPIGNEVYRFSGSFNGQGKIIKHLFINSTNKFIGLFGGNIGEIKNVGLDNINVSGTSFIGGLVGYNQGSITNSFSRGKVSISNNSQMYTFIGGLVGSNDGSIDNSYSNSTVSGLQIVGGLTGDNSGSISNSYSSGRVSGSSDVGGLSGDNYGSIQNSYSTANVSGSSNVGGLIGDNSHPGTVTNNYWNTETSGFSNAVGNGSSNGIIGKTTAQLMHELPDGFDAAVWAILPDHSFPYLKWQFANTPTAVSGVTSADATKSVTLLKNGSAFDTINVTGANGFYYKLYSNDNGNTFNAGDTLFAYVDGISGNSIWRAASNNADASGITSLDIAANTVTISGGSTGFSLNNSILANASPASANRLYSVLGTDITLQNNIKFIQKAGSYYLLNGNLTSQGNGNITFNSNVSLSKDVTIRANHLTLNSFIELGGNNLNLVANQFINNYGTDGLKTINAGGHWLVWSNNTNPFDNVTGDKHNGLVYNFEQYNTTFGQDVSGTGNGFIYAVAAPSQPPVTPTGNLAKIYDDNTYNNIVGTQYTINSTFNDKFIDQTSSFLNDYLDKVGTVLISGVLKNIIDKSDLPTNISIDDKHTHFTIDPSQKVYISTEAGTIIFNYIQSNTDQATGMGSASITNVTLPATVTVPSTKTIVLPNEIELTNPPVQKTGTTLP